MNAKTPGARIAVLGEALVDAFADGDVAGGAPYNVARNLAALGQPALFVSRVGTDAAGDAIAAEMAALGLDLRGLQRDPAAPTGRVDVVLDAGQPVFRIAGDAAWDRIDTAPAMHAVHGYGPRLLYFGTLAQRAPASRQAIRAVLAARPGRRLLDLNLRGIADERQVAADALALADLAKVNEDELERLLAWFAPAQARAETARAVDELLMRFGLEWLVCTRGARGWTCYRRDGAPPLEGAAPAVAVRDTVGAGDAFSAMVLLGEARGWPLATTLARAGAFAAQACTIRGAFDAASPVHAQARAAWAEAPARGAG